jgi:Cu-processing system permease protein
MIQVRLKREKREAQLAGTASASSGLLLAGLLVWIAAPLGLATVFFARREL